MDAPRKPYLTVIEYLALEREAEARSEYLDGEMFAMTGGSLRHKIISNLVRELGWQLKKSPAGSSPATCGSTFPRRGSTPIPT
jgi:Uma2 family endonuclease